MGRGVLARLSTVTAPARRRTEGAGAAYRNAFWSGEALPDPWISSLAASGITVTPELGMTLSAMYAGVKIISMDLATLPAQVFKVRDDGGKDRVRPFFGRGIDTSGGIRSLAYMLRWQPNQFQTATEFMLGQIAQYVLRGVAYAEIVSGPSGFLEQLLPRHPDRISVERLPSGRLRYRLSEAAGPPRYLTQDEMFVVRDLSLDGGITSISRVQYGAQAIGTALATQRAAGRFFKAGMTAAMLATYAGEKDDENEDALHKSISRFAAGIDNSFGLMLVPDDVKISNLGVEPEKAQMMLAQEWGVREVARLLNMPGNKLGIKDSVSYNSQVQSALDYVVSCLRPIAVTFEQAIQRDLILIKDTFFSEFLLEALLRGDPTARADYYEKAIRNRWMRPSEVRLRENLNPDPDLDRLSEGDFRAGAPAAGAPATGATPPAAAVTRPDHRVAYAYHMALHDSAVRCLRRERAAVEKLAKKHASDVTGWQEGLRDFYADHAAFVSATMRIRPELAREYAAQHGSAFETSGVVLIDGKAGEEWERFEAAELALLALDTVQAAA